MRVSSRSIHLLLLLGFLPTALFAQLSPRVRQNPDFVNFESPHVHPMDLNAERTKLAVCNTAAGRVEIFNVSASDGALAHESSIFTGMEPVSVRFRTNKELWVTNHLSDSITVVDVTKQRTLNLIKTADEPCDVVFAGDPAKAYVTCSQVNKVLVIDVANPQAKPEEMIIEGEDPRALSVSPDGRYVFAAVYESGNGTTILGGGRTDSPMLTYPPNVVSNPLSPYQGTNPAPNDGNNYAPAPSPLFPPTYNKSSLIVRKDREGRWRDDNNGDWTRFVSGDLAKESGREPGWDLVDNDLAIIDTRNDHRISYAESLMTTCMALGVNAETGDLTVIGTEANNQIRFEPNLNGKFIEVRQATIRVGADGHVEYLSSTDLNPHLDYSTPTVPQETRNLSIGDPRAIAWTEMGDKAFIAGMGSNNVIVIDSKGDRLLEGKTIDVGEGPTGLALHQEANRLYVLNRFEATVSVVDTEEHAELERVAYADPTPEFVRVGRRHLFNTHETSGLGQASCASCHVDARMDRLAWDLGVPQKLQTLDKTRRVDVISKGPATFENQTVKMSPMKGAMVTPTLQGIIGNGPFHWRGDRDDIEEFNATYEDLLGDDEELTKSEMTEFKHYLATIYFSPNPYRNADGTLSEEIPLPGEVASGQFELEEGAPLPAGNAKRGRELFGVGSFSRSFNTNEVGFLGGRSCAQCHAASLSGGYYHGRGSMLVTEMSESTMEVGRPPFLRDLPEKLGFRSQGKSLTGFGLLHDGSMDSLSRYMTQPLFSLDSDQEVADIIAYMLSINGDTFDTSGLLGASIQTRSAKQLISSTNAYDVHPGVGQQAHLDQIRQNPILIFGLFRQLADVDRGRDSIAAVLHASDGSGLQRSWVYNRIKERFFPDTYVEDSITSVGLLRREDLSGLVLTLTPHYSETTHGLDLDGDQLLNFDEIRDLDPDTAGIQNPFDPAIADSSGDDGSTEPDGISDHLNDFDGNGVSNLEEFQRGMNPLGLGRLRPNPPEVDLKIVETDRPAGYSLEYTTRASKVYEVESSHDLKTWTREHGSGHRASVSSKRRWPVPLNPDADGPVYYRIRVFDK